MSEEVNHADLLSLTTEIVSSYVSNNTVDAGDLPAVIDQVYKSLSGVTTDGSITADRPQPQLRGELAWVD